MQPSQLHYIKNVLGVESIFRPSSMNQYYKLYGRLNQEYLLFFHEDYTAEVKKLVFRMMNAIGVSSYACVQNLDFNGNHIQSLILRSSAKKVIFFGSKWKDFFQTQFDQDAPFNQVMKEESLSIKYFLTYALSDFLGDSSLVGKRKREVFSILKSF